MRNAEVKDIRITVSSMGDIEVRGHLQDDGTYHINHFIFLEDGLDYCITDIDDCVSSVNLIVDEPECVVSLITDKDCDFCIRGSGGKRVVRGGNGNGDIVIEEHLKGLVERTGLGTGKIVVLGEPIEVKLDMFSDEMQGVFKKLAKEYVEGYKKRKKD